MLHDGTLLFLPETWQNTLSNATFQVPVPDSLQQDPDSAEYFRALNLFINDLVAPEGVIATGAITAEVTLTQQEKLDLMTVTQSVNLDAIEAAINKIATSSPDYTISNDGTQRTLNADDAAGAITNPPTQADVENIRDAVLVIADFIATMNRDLQAKDVFG